ncbi:MAG: prepilin-type N-terminal cleavage/methylation domain-containing protein [Verrucomicrobiales bacterium]|jgi:uncharacterized protein (TIGR02599 family)|nr:prepilin-type N-terminal cleavage/methylation domain-containing protein [Verrucomicrobiales bacterium]
MRAHLNSAGTAVFWPWFSGKVRRGFSLTELLVAMAIFIVLMQILLSTIGQSAGVLQRTKNTVGSYQSARLAFNMITRTLGQSRMNVYEDYDNPSQPGRYLRKSNLHFVIDDPQGVDFKQGNAIFFQAALGRTQNNGDYGNLPALLNSVGYYVTYGKNPNLPLFLRPFDRHRFRLMQFLTPAEEMNVYSSGSVQPKSWFQAMLSDYSNVIADNVILVLFWPRLAKEEDPVGSSLTGNYRYDSHTGEGQIPQPVTNNQQPPLVQVTMVAIDETAANRLPDTETPPSQVADALQGLFTRSTEEGFKQDFAELERRLTAAKISYQTFNSMVSLRETKWSKQ